MTLINSADRAKLLQSAASKPRAQPNIIVQLSGSESELIFRQVSKNRAIRSSHFPAPALQHLWIILVQTFKLKLAHPLLWQ
jgi:hypothetical protein